MWPVVKKSVLHSPIILCFIECLQRSSISRSSSQKYLCDICTAFNNADNEGKENLRRKYNQYLKEKELSREEKNIDKLTSEALIDVYDLKAVVQLPMGDVSLVYYKCKLSVLNFTMYNLKLNTCESFVWDEGNGYRGVNELGSCVLK